MENITRQYTLQNVFCYLCTAALLYIYLLFTTEDKFRNLPTHSIRSLFLFFKPSGKTLGSIEECMCESTLNTRKCALGLGSHETQQRKATLINMREYWTHLVSHAVLCNVFTALTHSSSLNALS